MRNAIRIGLFALSALAAAAGCGDDDPPPYSPAEQTGMSCTAASQCFPNLEGGTLQGTPVCIDKVTNGYCTHTCQADADCCAVPGECRTSYPQVCSPFESTGDKYCFLSCEDADMAGSNATDATSFCHTYAHVSFACRSSGGGSENRKVCVP